MKNLFGISDFNPSFLTTLTTNTGTLMYACYGTDKQALQKYGLLLPFQNYIDTSISKLICCNTAIKCSTSCQSFLANMKANESELIYFCWIVLPANMFISYL